MHQWTGVGSDKQAGDSQRKPRQVSVSVAAARQIVSLTVGHSEDTCTNIPAEHQVCPVCLNLTDGVERQTPS